MPLLNNRLQKLAPGGYQIPSPTGGPDVPDISNRLSSLSNSEDATGSEYNTPILDQYKKTLANPPIPENYAPSKTRQVLGALAGMGAGASAEGMTHGGPVGFRYDPKAQIGAQQAITDEPLNKAMGRYSTQAAILGKGAQVEEQDIAQKRGIEKLQADIAAKDQLRSIENHKLEIASQKEENEHQDRVTKMQNDIDKLNAQLAEKGAIADQVNKTAEEKVKAYKEALDIHNEITKATNALRDEREKDTERQRKVDNERHDKEYQAIKERADAYKKHIDDLGKEKEAASKQKAAPTTTTTEEKKVGGIDIPLIGNVFGKKQKVVTKTQQPNADPLGIR